MAINNQEYTEFLIELIDVWLDDDPIPIHTLEDCIKTIASARPANCVFSENCTDDFIAIDYQGDVYPCNCFAGVKKLAYGNIIKNDLKTIMNSSASQKWQNHPRPRACISCEYWRYCHGGCYYHSYSVTGNPFDKYPYCESFKALFNHLTGKLQKLESPES